MPVKYCLPKNDLVEVKGSLSYQESAQAWNTLRLQRRLVDEFPVLRDRSKMVFYRGMLCRTQEKLNQVLKVVKEDGKVPIPLLLFLYQEDQEAASSGP